MKTEIAHIKEKKEKRGGKTHRIYQKKESINIRRKDPCKERYQL